MKATYLSIGFLAELLFLMLSFGEAQIFQDISQWSHAPSIFLFQSIFGKPTGDSFPWRPLLFSFVVQWAIYAAIVFGLLRLIRHARRNAAYH